MQDKPSRFSVLILMALVGILGVGLGVMRNGSETADQVVFSVTFLAMLVGLLGALVRRGAAWVGFALFGWAFLLPTIVPGLGESFHDRLMINPMIEALVERSNNIPPLPPDPPFRQATNPSGNQDGKIVDGQWVPMSAEDARIFKDYLKRTNEHWSLYKDPVSSSRLGHSRRIGHSVLILLIATLGVLLGRSLSSRSPIDASSASGPATSAT